MVDDFTEHIHTNTEVTKATSTAVGTMLNTKAVRTKLIPRLPRSMAFASDPVCLFR